MTLSGKTALVTASSKGLGFASAHKLLAEGCRVIISSSNEENILAASRFLSQQFDTEVPYFICNLRDINSSAGMIDGILDRFGGVDILVNNCGGPAAGYFADLSDDAWESGHIEILRSAQKLIHAFLPGMRARKFGRIVNITSVAVKSYIDNLIISTTYRAALGAFSSVLAKQVAVDNVTINTVAPGFTLTERINHLANVRAEAAGLSPDDILKGMLVQVPAARFASPEEVADAVAFFCKPGSGYITANVLTVDGGYSRNI